MFAIRNLVEQYTNRKAEVLKRPYADVIRTTCLCIIFKTMNGTEVFIDMHPEMEFAQLPEYRYMLPNSRDVFRKFDFEVTSGENIVLTEGIKFKPWTLNTFIKYQLEEPISERKFNEFISDNGGIDTIELTENINRLWELQSA